MFSEKVKQKLWQGFLVGLMSMVLSFLMFLPAKAADYNCGAYGAGSFQNSVCGASDLNNTGQPFWQVLIAAVLIIAGVFLLLRSRKNMKTRAKTKALDSKPEDSTNLQ